MDNRNRLTSINMDIPVGILTKLSEANLLFQRPYLFDGSVNTPADQKFHKFEKRKNPLFSQITSGLKSDVRNALKVSQSKKKKKSSV